MAIPSTLKALGTSLTIIGSGASNIKVLVKSLEDLTTAQKINVLSQNQSLLGTKALNAEQLKEILIKSGLTDGTEDLVVQKILETNATKAQDAANKSATVSLTGLKNGVKGLANSFKMLDTASKVILGITAAIAVFQGIKWIIDQVTVTLEEQKEVVSNLSSEISSLQSEYEQLSSKTDLTDAEQRKLELLQAQLAVKKEQIALEAKKQEEKQFTSDVTDTVNDPDSGTVSYTKKGTRSQAYDEVGNYEAAKKSLEEYNAEIEKYSNVTGLSADKVKEANAALTSAQQSRDKATKQMSDAKSVIVDDIAALEDLKEKTGSLEPENQKLLDYLHKMATEFGFFTDSVKEVPTDSLSSSLSDLKTSASTLSEQTKKLTDSYDDFQLISDVVNDKTYLTLGQVSKLVAAYPDLESKIKLTTSGWTLESGAIDVVSDSMTGLQSAMVSAQQNMTKIANSQIAERINAFGVELSAIHSVMDAYAAAGKAMKSDSSWDTLRSKFFDKDGKFIGDAVAYNKAYQDKLKSDQEIEQTIINYGKNAEAIQKAQDALNTATSKGFGQTSKADKEAAKTKKYENKALEEQLALLEHRKAMGEFESDDLKKKAELSLQYVRELEKITKYTKTQDELNENREQVYQAYQDHYADVSAYQKEEYDNALKIIQSKKDYNLYENNSIQLSKDLLEVKRKYARTQEQIEEINKQIHDADRQALSEQEDAMKRAESAVERVIDKRIKALQEEQDALEKYYQKKIDRIQDEIDTLQDANDERAKQLALEKAQAAWEAAQNQKTISIYRDGLGFVYEADQDAINEAGENLADAKLDIRIDELNKKKQELEDSLDKEKQALQNSIDDWEDYKDKWSDILDEYSNSQDELIMKQLLGKDAEADILDQRLDKLSEFRDKYIALQKEIAEFDGKAVKSSSSSSSSSKKSNGNIITKETYVDSHGSTRTHTTIRVDRNSLPASMIGGRASGDISVKRSGIYNVDEEGPEAILGAPTRGQYQWLHQNDKVFDADATKNLWDIANNPIDFISKRLGPVFEFSPKFQFASPSTGDKQVTNRYHIDKIDFPNATNTEQIQRAFAGLPDYFIQKSTSNL